MNTNLLSQNPLNETDLNSATKDIQESIQFLQENAEPTTRPIAKEASVLPFGLSIYTWVILTVLGVIAIRIFSRGNRL
ncbi:hypothetical protein KBC70_04830 [Candidatus Woesebacteria bacterium]|nr:hypothetical protein [Candidatus Woesebacteria bacterium]